MARLTKQQDAFGQAMWDYHNDRGGNEIVERDDGGIEASGGPAMYLAEYRKWSVLSKQAIRLARGRVLDIGCGAGRICLHLQQKGLDVTGIDTSPLAVKTCKARGVKDARVLSITGVGPKLGTFDTIVMFGNNFGLFGGFKRARWLLRRFRNMTTPSGRIIAEATDPYQTTLPFHLAYHKLNRRRGRMGGQVRIRVRYRTLATPWFDYLLASKDEVREILAGTGWQIGRFIDTPGPGYAAVIEKQ